MDRIGLQTLQAELLADCAEASSTLALVRERMALPSAAGLEAAAFHLARLYNILEQLALRVAKAFENHIDNDEGWHSELMHRVALQIPDVRPALWPSDLVAPLGQLRRFRHVINHAYDLTLDRDRLLLVIRDADKVVANLRPACERFIAEVAKLIE